MEADARDGWEMSHPLLLQILVFPMRSLFVVLLNNYCEVNWLIRHLILLLPLLVNV